MSPCGSCSETAGFLKQKMRDGKLGRCLQGNLSGTSLMVPYPGSVSLRETPLHSHPRSGLGYRGEEPPTPDSPLPALHLHREDLLGWNPRFMNEIITNYC